MYARVITKADSKNLGLFMKNNVNSQANIRTDGWSGYKPLKKFFPNLKQEKSETKGSNFNHIHRVIMGFKGWLRGIHSRVELLQNYLDEYCYRFNRSQMKEGIFDNLLNRMMESKPVNYKMIIG